MKNLTIVAAAVLYDARAKKILLTNRPADKSWAGYWEFPGGKVEVGETPEQALVRELQEELAITVAPKALQPLTFISHAYQEKHVLIPLYGCTQWQGDLVPQEQQQMAWCAWQEIKNYQILPSNLAVLPLLEKLFS